MSRKQAKCIDRERDFQLEELFFSTTNLRGVIESGNDVFVRVSGYCEAELIGQPHSKIRHPDMPASVFSLFWDRLQAGHSIAAYVKNRAKDGEYYWVMAVAKPVDGGYLSVRLKPSSSVFSIVEDVYARVLADEQSAAAEGLSKDAIVEVGLASLNSEIRRLDFDDYVGFMHHALTLETIGRQRGLTRQTSLQRLTPKQRLDSTEFQSLIADLVIDNAQCDHSMASMLDRLSNLGKANTGFLRACDAISEQSQMISVVALNANVSATTGTLEAIAGELAAAEKDNREVLSSMTTTIRRVSGSLAELGYNISVAALFSEIGSHFLKEVQGSDSSSAPHALPVLLREADEGLQRLFQQLDHAHDWFREIAGLTQRLQRNAKTLRFIRMAGVTESTLLPPGHAFAGLFDEVKVNIHAMMGICSNLRNEIGECQSTLKDLEATRGSLVGHLQRVRENSTALVGRRYARLGRTHAAPSSSTV